MLSSSAGGATVSTTLSRYVPSSETSLPDKAAQIFPAVVQLPASQDSGAAAARCASISPGALKPTAYAPITGLLECYFLQSPRLRRTAPERNGGRAGGRTPPAELRPPLAFSRHRPPDTRASPRPRPAALACPPPRRARLSPTALPTPARPPLRSAPTTRLSPAPSATEAGGGTPAPGRPGTRGTTFRSRCGGRGAAGFLKGKVSPWARRCEGGVPRGVLLRVGGTRRDGTVQCGAVRHGAVRRDSPTALQRPRRPLPWGQVPPLKTRGLAGPDPRPGVAEGSDWANQRTWGQSRWREGPGRQGSRLPREGPMLL
ncbi:PREDICTED: translation initiation factor IF-2-like [Calidris pugnax]|uniref:translation initiation factor IF-2-like n=1 Tax=Calidris pugnax TaxID=198806 RepID=UPI00071E63C5|nr:PREDICTED: translation initiation factor IF-2-like [Calidris pugnax]